MCSEGKPHTRPPSAFQWDSQEKRARAPDKKRWLAPKSASGALSPPPSLSRTEAEPKWGWGRLRGLASLPPGRAPLAEPPPPEPEAPLQSSSSSSSPAARPGGGFSLRLHSLDPAVHGRISGRGASRRGGGGGGTPRRARRGERRGLHALSLPQRPGGASRALGTRLAMAGWLAGRRLPRSARCDGDGGHKSSNSSSSTASLPLSACPPARLPPLLSLPQFLSPRSRFSGTLWKTGSLAGAGGGGLGPPARPAASATPDLAAG